MRKLAAVFSQRTRRVYDRRNRSRNCMGVCACVRIAFGGHTVTRRFQTVDLSHLNLVYQLQLQRSGGTRLGVVCELVEFDLGGSSCEYLKNPHPLVADGWG